MPLSLQEIDSKIADMSIVPQTPQQKPPEVWSSNLMVGLGYESLYINEINHIVVEREQL